MTLIRHLNKRKPYWRLKMRKSLKKAIVTLTVLVPLAIGLSGCVSGQDTLKNKIQVNPSANYLYALAREDATKTCGPATDAVKNDWIAQNEPDYQ
jgi:hypothetical protein